MSPAGLMFGVGKDAAAGLFKPGNPSVIKRSTCSKSRDFFLIELDNRGLQIVGIPLVRRKGMIDELADVVPGNPEIKISKSGMQNS